MWPLGMWPGGGCSPGTSIAYSPCAAAVDWQGLHCADTRSPGHCSSDDRSDVARPGIIRSIICSRITPGPKTPVNAGGEILPGVIVPGGILALIMSTLEIWTFMGKLGGWI